MRIFTRSIAAALAAIVLAASPVFAQNATTTAGQGDVTPTLGSSPFFPNGLKLDPYGSRYRQITDSTPVAPAVVGNIMAYSPITGLWALTVLPGQIFPAAEYGVVTSAATSLKGSATVLAHGFTSALCVTNATQAIAPGTMLTTDGAGNLTTLSIPSTPLTPTVTPTGGTATSWTYKVVPVSADGIPGTASATGTTAVGAATLTPSAFNTITWVPTADAASYIIVRTVAAGTPNTLGVIGVVSAQTAVFNDTGLAILPNTSATQYFQLPAAGGTPTVAAQGTTGATTYTYKITAIMPNGVWGAEGTAASTTTGNAVLSTTNYNKITWTATTGAVLYAIDRTAAGGLPNTTGLVGYALPAQAVSGFNDTGLAATTFASSVQVVPNPSPRGGIVIGIAAGSLASSTSTPTLTNVFIAGL